MDFFSLVFYMVKCEMNRSFSYPPPTTNTDVVNDPNHRKLTEGHPVVLDSLVEHGGQPQLGLLADVRAAHDQTDPVRLVQGDTHVRLNLRDRLSEN